MPDFRKLVVWQKAHQLALRTEQVASRVRRRKPGLANQLERAADSVPAAIAEGRGRGTDADFANYVSMAIGSVTEVENHLQRGYDGGVIPKQDYGGLTEAAIAIRRMLIGLRRTLRGQPRPPRDPNAAAPAQVQPPPQPEPKQPGPELMPQAPSSTSPTAQAESSS
jgi:four helix bundle protein